MIAIDTNLLVYAHRSATPEHRAAWAALESAANLPGRFAITLPSVAEFNGIVTHPAASGRPSSPGEAAAAPHAQAQSGGSHGERPRAAPLSGCGWRALGVAERRLRRGCRAA